jgi:colanic acid/amylovoran biosynthesis glycosyltransferase
VPRLVVVAPGDLYVRDSVIAAPAKFVSGMEMFAAKFPGEVHLLGRPASVPDSDNLGAQALPIDELDFECHVTSDLAAALRSLDPDVALLSLSEDHASLIGIAGASVVAAEHAARSWLAMSLADEHSLLDRARMEVGYRRLERRLTRVVESADGLHCNGVVAWTSYGSHSPDAIRVYDSRVTSTVVERAKATRKPWSGGLLRLGFSGRLTSIKGPQYVVGLPALLGERGIAATVDVFGDGPMRKELEASGSAVRFHGTLDYEREWCPYIAENIDLMVLPHVQPDPSGTYFESAGVGVPVLGFQHETTRDLARHGWVFASEQRSAASLADSIAHLVGDTASLQAASAAGFGFMQTRTFEMDFGRRVEHLVRVMSI